MSLNATSDDRFADEVLDSALPVLVEFTAQWCGPCRVIARVLTRIAQDEAARLRVVTLDVDENTSTALRYGVMGMPTVALFVDGEVVSRFVGARGRTAIMAELEPHLGRSVPAGR